MSKPIPTISKYMTTVPRTVDSETTLLTATRVMREGGFRHLPVMQGERLLGIITDRDIRLVESFDNVDAEKTTVGEAMTDAPYAVPPETPLDEVVATMAEHKYGSAVVVQNAKVVGVFTTVDVCRALSELLSSRLRKS
jgi:acetoin utilization protein AcuB